ncbi:MAG: isoaspartyl peptidase/L-asparaginase family protein [Desulfobacteraceae bacterium]
MKPKIIVHGGARNQEADEAERRQDVIAACEEAYEVLQEKGAVDAVELAVRRLEASRHLNAGVGSYLQLDGRVRMDASVMKDDLSAGAVIGIEDVEHPIAVARKVMEETQHIALAGPLATEFARSEGFPKYDPRTRQKVEIWFDILEQLRTQTTYEQLFHVDKCLFDSNEALGTVGCVAMDSSGRMAAGTSTGGLKMNVPGRVGDSPIIGAGTYCSKYGGISCTGVGEKIMVLCLAKEASNYLQYNPGKNAMDAARHSLNLLGSIGGRGGLICIDHKGGIGHAFNTEAMTIHWIE